MTTLTEHNDQTAERLADLERQVRLDRMRPTYPQRCSIAGTTGSCTDSSPGTRSYCHTVRRPTGALVTLAACRFDQPDREIARVRAVLDA